MQLGKFVKMERQPIRVLESYGLAATSFNRFEDVGVMAGGSIGRNLYWRLTGTSGNPLYFRDPNALAGDNGIKELLQPNPDPQLKSGFPILYDTRVEDLALDTKNMSFGQGLGYRWQNDAQTFGFDAVAFHYRRKLRDDENAPLTGTFYGVDLDLLERSARQQRLPIRGNKKEETGARVYTEWRGLTSTIQFTSQNVAGMHRSGAEGEFGYKFDCRADRRSAASRFCRASSRPCAGASCTTDSKGTALNIRRRASGGTGRRSTPASASASRRTST